MSRAPTRTVTIRFDEAEAWLVAEALHHFQPAAPADRLRLTRMRDLIETELGGEQRR
jgi:hypothetical protein